MNKPLYPMIEKWMPNLDIHKVCLENPKAKYARYFQAVDATELETRLANAGRSHGLYGEQLIISVPRQIRKKEFTDKQIKDLMVNSHIGFNKPINDIIDDLFGGENEKEKSSIIIDAPLYKCPECGKKLG